MPTTATVPTGSGTDTGNAGYGATSPIDTAPPACVACLGAADLAGEKGGSSCSIAPNLAGGWLMLGLVGLILRRR